MPAGELDVAEHIVWTASTPLTVSQRRAFEDFLPYCLPQDCEPRIEYHDGVAAIGYTADPVASAKVTHQLSEAHARALIEPAREPRVLLDVDSEPGPRTSQAERACWVGPGLRVRGAEISRLIRVLDHCFLGLAQRFGAVEYTVPHLVSWDTAYRAGYPRNFPQHVTTCGVVGPDLSALDGFADTSHAADAFEHVTPAPAILAPTVCMNIFAAFADQSLEEQRTVTARGMCTRYEAGSPRSSTRLWSFDMREIVFVGTSAATREFRAAILESVIGLARDIGLPATVSTAGDPFFTSAKEQLLEYQSGFELKHELRGRLADGSGSTAVTSVNLHHQQFGTRFAITLPDGAPAHSACVGFGLDRWAEWLSGYLPDDPAEWPEPLRPAGGRI